MLDRGHRVTLVAPAEAPIAPAGERAGIPVVRLDIRRKRLPALLALRRWLARNGAARSTSSTRTARPTAGSARSPARRCQARRRSCARGTCRRRSATARRRAGSTRTRPRTSSRPARRCAGQLARDNAIPLAHMTSIPHRHRPRALRARRRASRRGSGSACRARPTLGIVATLRDWKGHEYLLRRDRRRPCADGRAGTSSSSATGRTARSSTRGSRRSGSPSACASPGSRRTSFPGSARSTSSRCRPTARRACRRRSCRRWPARLPVVSTTVGAIAEAVADDVTGLIVAPRDAPALAAALARLRDDPELRARFGAAARRLAQQRFGSTACWTGWKRCSAPRRERTDHVRHRRLLRSARAAARDRRAHARRAAPARSRCRAREVSGRADFRDADGARRRNALLHTRLSIIDPRPEADQPMGNDAGDVLISLQRRGLRLGGGRARRSRRAGYPLPHALRHRVHPARATSTGASSCVARLRGMFAIAIVDLRQRARLRRSATGSA